MSTLPGGTLTFVFTDVEGSTSMWDASPDAAAAAMAAHDQLMRRSIDDWNGTFVKGTGDGILAVFGSAADALAAAVEFQLAWNAETGLEAQPTVRVALHTGPAVVRRDDYYGLAPTECARVLSAIHGGQVCLTDDTCLAIGDATPPDVELRDLGQHRLRGISEPVRIYQATHPHLPAAFPPLRAVEAFRHNLPAALTSFVGRTEEVAEAEKLLRSSRMLTIVGAGGSGKSRLALEVASDTVDDFPDGVWLVELAPLRDPGLIARTIGSALGVAEEPARDDLTALVSRLTDQELLLVLDNCDHLVGGSAEVARRILTECPRIRILATSRQRLGVSGETTLTLAPMTVPRLEDLDDPGLIVESDAVQLFLARARLADPGFELTAANCRSVGQICRVVDGIPLAIELAAGRLASLAPREIAARLTEQIHMLAGGAGQERHQTLERALDWSYSTLDDGEREMFADLSVFRGGFQLDAAERVCHIATFADCVQGVSDLVEKSMLTRDQVSGRYRYLEPIRLYARGKLAATDRDPEVRERHADYFAQLVGPEAMALGAEHAAWMDRVAAEHDNIRSALAWSLEHDRGALALRIAGGVWPFWKHAGHVTEGRSWLDRSLAAAVAPDPGELERALLGAGDLAATQDDRAAAERYLTRALARAEERRDDVAATTVLVTLASLPHRAGDLAEANRRFEGALERARRGGDLPQTASILASLALLKEDQGQIADAERYAAEALSLRRETDDQYAVSDALLTVGEISINRGRFEEARRVLEEALEISTGSGFQDIRAWATAYLGTVALSEGNDLEASRLLEDALGRFQQRGQPNGAAWAMRHLGRAALALGDLERASALLGEALDLSLRHVVPDAPAVLLAISELDVARGDYEEAAYLLAVADAARENMSLVGSAPDEARAVEVRSIVAAGLPPERLDELTTAGAETALDELPPLLAGALRTQSRSGG
jgi:predicted ATPase/class 3 adenylate cyclase